MGIIMMIIIRSIVGLGSLRPILGSAGHRFKAPSTQPAGDVLWVFVEPGNVVP